jgi:dihydroxyacetone kinase
MISLLVSTEDSDRSFVPFENGDEIVLLVNSLGSTGDNVLARFAELAVEELENEWGYKVKRVTLGGFVTSLKMSGVGITVWRLSSKDEVMGKEEALKEWDRRVKCVGWRQ